MSEKLLVPDIGDFENVEVIEILVKPGDQIKENDPIVKNYCLKTKTILLVEKQGTVVPLDLWLDPPKHTNLSGPRKLCT